MLDNFKHYNHLGFFSNYYYTSNNDIVIKNTFSKILEEKKSKNVLDTFSVVSVLTKSYMLGDRTLIKDVYKTPWMAKPAADNSSWNYYTPSKHDKKEYSIAEISTTLLKLLREEVLAYVEGKKNVAILLTGGMDSRIVAGVLDSLIRDKLIDVNVVGLTWGNKNSRDVVYAERIAKKMNWEWHHIEITAEDLENNIDEVSKRGCEMSPVHYHAMAKVRSMKNIDCILAGSFGDSIGRSEYSSKTVLQIRDLRETINNRYGIFKDTVMPNFLQEVNLEIENYWNRFRQNEQYQQIEQDYQIHYMRRMLNPCMAMINERIPVFQIFTAPNVFEYVWSLHPKVRNNNIYKQILKSFTTDLLDIPWARTGLLYDETKGKPDKYDKNNHNYSIFFKEVLFQEVKKHVLTGNIKDLDIFNMKTLKVIFNQMNSKFYEKDENLEYNMMWLASLSKAIKQYNIESDNNLKYTLKDNFNKFLPYKQNFIIKSKRIYNNLS